MKRRFHHDIHGVQQLAFIRHNTEISGNSIRRLFSARTVTVGFWLSHSAYRHIRLSEPARRCGRERRVLQNAHQGGIRDTRAQQCQIFRPGIKRTFLTTSRQQTLLWHMAERVLLIRYGNLARARQLLYSAGRYERLHRLDSLRILAALATFQLQTHIAYAVLLSAVYFLLDLRLSSGYVPDVHSTSG